MDKPRIILFLTGTRADFGKLKLLIRILDDMPKIESSLFVTGMHTLSRYGYTVDEIYKNIPEKRLSNGFRNIYCHMNQVPGDSMELALAQTIEGFSRYVNELKPDLIVVHGDRVETLAGAIVGALRNIRVAHIEGGEISGTVDELIRHSVSKLAHIHFVSNEQAAFRLRQMGERPDSIFIIGSPDIEIMLSENLPCLDTVKEYYGLPFDKYAIALFHPVTTNSNETLSGARAMTDAMLASSRNFVVIYPNNDTGSDLILTEYQRLSDNPRIRLYPSLRLEYFLSLLRHADFLVGNSSAGIRETPVYGVYSINIGSRQSNRHRSPCIINASCDAEAIRDAMRSVDFLPPLTPEYSFGHGGSAGLFARALGSEEFWKIPCQKQFMDLPTHILNCSEPQLEATPSIFTQEAGEPVGKQ